jgi:membrane associated rhomboid family serine protease
LSQGIESTVLDRDGVWGLELPSELRPRAEEILRLYRGENRHWHRYFNVRAWGSGFDFRVLLWALLLVAVQATVAGGNPGVWDRGVVSTQALLEGKLWGLWTAISLHADLRHLMGNLVFGTLVLGLAMARFGAGWAQLVSLLGGVAGNVLSAAVHGLDHRGLGASGMVMAGLGMLATGSIPTTLPSHPMRGFLLRSFMAGLLLFILLGVDPTSDVVAHAGGFIFGSVGGVILRRVPPDWRGDARINAGLALIALGMMVVAWAVAR